MSKNFKRIKKNYDKGFYSKENLKAIVGKTNGITEEEYELITGEIYEP